jgi:ABC-type lipoprotein release transport system permease subunit
MIATLAWRNLWRQPRRTLLSSLAIAFTTVFLIFMPSWQYGSYVAMIENTLRLFDGYAQIQQPGYRDDPEIRNSIRNPALLLKELKQLLGTKVVSARAESYALLTSDERSFGVRIVGVQPEREPAVSTIPGNIRDGRYLQNEYSDEVVLGETLAKNLRVGIGNRVTLLSMGRDGSLAADSLQVTGVFSTGIKEMDRLVAEMPLSRFQETFSMPGQVHTLVLGAESLSDFQLLVKPIRAIATQHHLATLDWKQLQPGLLQGILLDISSAVLIYVAMIVVVTFSLLNSLLMSVLERTREFGMLMALGMRPGMIGRMVWMETLLLLAVGLGAGIMIGFAITQYYANVGIYFGETQEVFAKFGLPGAMYPQINPFTLLAGPTVIAVCILLAGIYPLLRIYRLQPIQAMGTV